MRQFELPRSSPIADLALSPDGQTLAVAHRSHGIGLYDPFDGAVRHEFRGHFAQLAFRPDGRWLVGSKPTGIVIDLGAAEPQFDYLRVNEYVLAGEFPDDDSVAFVSTHCHRCLRLPTATGSYGDDFRPFLRFERTVHVAAPAFHFQPIGIGPGHWLVGAEYDHNLREQVAVILRIDGRFKAAVVVAVEAGLQTEVAEAELGVGLMTGREEEDEALDGHWRFAAAEIVEPDETVGEGRIGVFW